jgi:hypothetical protein
MQYLPALISLMYYKGWDSTLGTIPDLFVLNATDVWLCGRSIHRLYVSWTVQRVAKGLEFLRAELASVSILSILNASLIKEVRESWHSIERLPLSVGDACAAHSNDSDCDWEEGDRASSSEKDFGVKLGVAVERGRDQVFKHLEGPLSPE